MNVACYCRFSSDNQKQESIDAQLRAINDYCTKEGYNLIKIYKDEAQSATNDDREGFLSIFSDIAEGLFKSLDIKALIVHKLDRFARNRYDSAIYSKKLKEGNVRKISITERLDDSPESVILESMLEGMGEYYSKNLAREVKKGMNENALKCKSNGAPALFGFSVDETKNYIINEEEAKIVRKIFNDYVGGMSHKAIIMELNAKGYRTRNGKEYKQSSLSRMLKNEKYIGVYKYADVVIKGGLPQIIDNETFNNARKIAESRLGNAQMYKAKELYLLSSVLHCSCGGHMNGSRRKSRGKMYAHYFCMESKLKGTCSMRSITKPLAEKIVLDYLEQNTFTEDNINEIVSALENDDGTDKAEKEIADMTRNMARIDRSISNMMQAIEDGMYNPSMKVKLASLEDEKQLLVESITTLKNKPITSASDIREKYEVGKNLKDKSLEEQKIIIETFVKKIVFDGDSFEFDIYN